MEPEKQLWKLNNAKFSGVHPRTSIFAMRKETKANQSIHVQEREQNTKNKISQLGSIKAFITVTKKAFHEHESFHSFHYLNTLCEK